MDGVKEKIDSSIGFHLLTQFQSGKITFTDFMRECAYWAIKDGFDNLRPLAMPTKPNTSGMNEYESMDKKTRDKLNTKYYEDNPEINQFFDELHTVQEKNKAIFEWLNTILEYIPREDTVNWNKVDNRIKEFVASSDLPDDVKRMVSIFGGRAINKGGY